MRTVLTFVLSHDEHTDGVVAFLDTAQESLNAIRALRIDPLLVLHDASIHVDVPECFELKDGMRHEAIVQEAADAILSLLDGNPWEPKCPDCGGANVQPDGSFACPSTCQASGDYPTAWFVNEDGEAYQYYVEGQAEHFPNDNHKAFATREEAEKASRTGACMSHDGIHEWHEDENDPCIGWMMT